MESTVITIDAYVVFAKCVVRVPSPMANGTWYYRIHGTQPFWEYNGLILLRRHSTCQRAVFPRPWCRNCNHRKLWRRECEQPDDTYYILSAVNTALALAVLREITILTIPTTVAQQAAFIHSVPKTFVRGDYSMIRARSAPLPEFVNHNGKRPARSKSTSDLADLDTDLDTFLNRASDSQILDMFMGPDVSLIEQSAREDIRFEGLDSYDTLLTILQDRSYIKPNDAETIRTRSVVPMVRPSTLLAKAFQFMLKSDITADVQLWPKKNKWLLHMASDAKSVSFIFITLDLCKYRQLHVSPDIPDWFNAGSFTSYKTYETACENSLEGTRPVCCVSLDHQSLCKGADMLPLGILCD